MKVRLNYTKWQIALQILVFLLLIAAVFAGLRLAMTKQEIRKKASSVEMTLTLYPTSETFIVGDIKSFDLKATFSGGSGNEKIDYFKTVITFPQELKIPLNPQYAIVLPSSLKRVIQVDDPATANQKGKIQIELGALHSNEGPTTIEPYTVFRIHFQAVAKTDSPQPMSFESSQVVNNSSAVISTTANGASVMVNEPLPSITPTPSIMPSTITPTCTPPSCPAPPEGCSYETHDSCSCGVLVCPIPSITPSNTPFPSRQPTLTPTASPTLPSDTPVPPSPTKPFFPTLTPTSIPVPPTSTSTPFPPSPTEIVVTITISPSTIACTKKSLGDANCDGIVDGTDYSIWLNSQCPSTRPTNAVCSNYSADFNNDTNIDDNDLVIWLQNRI